MNTNIVPVLEMAGLVILMIGLLASVIYVARIFRRI